MILYENRIIKFAYQVLCAVEAELNVFFSLPRASMGMDIEQGREGLA
jgi:hypothetical protein